MVQKYVILVLQMKTPNEYERDVSQQFASPMLHIWAYRVSFNP